MKKLTGIKSKYTGVSYSFRPVNRSHVWKLCFTYKGKKARKDFPYTDEGEKLAAIAYDKLRLEHGLEPVNILKPKV